jgi:hypothetical protein
MLGRLFKSGAAAERGAQAVAGPPTVGSVRKLNRTMDLVDVRTGVFFKIFACPASDEPPIGPNDVDMAVTMAERAQKFYKHSAELFPPDDIFYEEVEAHYIDSVTRIDNDGHEDQFVGTLDQARRLTNDNTRVLYCELAPLALGLVLILHAGLLLFDPFGLLLRETAIWSLRGAQLFAAEAMFLGIALGLAVFFTSLVYWFSYSHIQRANALSLNVFITTEFARLNNVFRVAQREAMQAETQLADTQKEELRRLASSWTLSYHWIGVRQFLEEMFTRNVMFQIRRNTTLYRVLGVVICAAMLAAIGTAAAFASGLQNAHTPALIVWLHLSAITLGYCVVVYGLVISKPFSIVASAQLKDQWYRYNTLTVGDAIAEQVTRDKVQIVINRDRARAAGV